VFAVAYFILAISYENATTTQIIGFKIAIFCVAIP
jgi:hypothetical protein|tara:strand:- start:191 stop:295 length:105 start_codon:yes stop_codon:yes gene_type:complete